ncbi:copper chaperone PCu(A)C [Xenophilus arseniciresistens]|uniref:Copper chaperone PCu(A)C n=1 Tax=Xenophilus arseniciresistens TaxID=1283306 RepID=A0AAE3N9P0_9BURK|nr:copper chaperone PCu(A)C [Xenophilus arseniciresistens]MDA7417383.1 copper chaperone PCu(A)C [Xenophilus arseniciresistens]
MRIQTRPTLAFIALLGLGAAAQAQVSVTQPWVRATVAQQQATGAFMQLQSPTATRLVGVSTPLTAVAELHEMAMQGDVMRMRHVPVLELPAGKAVELRPGGHHLMLMNLKAQVKEGQTVPLTLTFESPDGKRETVQVQAPVRALTAQAAGGHAGHGAAPAHKH